LSILASLQCGPAKDLAGPHHVPGFCYEPQIAYEVMEVGVPLPPGSETMIAVPDQVVALLGNEIDTADVLFAV